MSSDLASAEIPKRALFKAAEVCELMKVQPYELRTWEAEFPNLGIAKAGGPRVYRRSDVEQVARIKHLIIVDGLTLAGARRRLDEESAPLLDIDEPGMAELLGQNARERITEVKRGLQSILELLSEAAGSPNRLRLDMPRAAQASQAPAPRARERSKPSRGKGTSRSSAASASSARRNKRSA